MEQRIVKVDDLKLVKNKLIDLFDELFDFKMNIMCCENAACTDLQTRLFNALTEYCDKICEIDKLIL